MKNIPTPSLSFYKNSSGIPVGLLKSNGKPILATTHPATIAAALFAMNMEKCELTLGGMVNEIFLPFVCTSENAEIMNFSLEEKFVLNLGIFSGIDFLNPPAFDRQAETHFRTAVHHLPKNLVVKFPASPAPKSFKKELKERNKYIYFPYC